MECFKSWLCLEGVVNTVYHVTFLKNIGDIFTYKLVPRGGSSIWEKPHLVQHSRKGVFICKDLHCANKWVEILMEQAHHVSDNPIEEEWIPIILKFRINRNKRRLDTLGSQEVEGSHFSLKSIDPQGIQLWDGRKWSTDPADAWNIQYHFQSLNEPGQFDNFDTDEYPFPTI